MYKLQPRNPAISLKRQVLDRMGHTSGAFIERLEPVRKTLHRIQAACPIGYRAIGGTYPADIGEQLYALDGCFIGTGKDIDAYPVFRLCVIPKGIKPPKPIPSKGHPGYVFDPLGHVDNVMPRAHPSVYRFYPMTPLDAIKQIPAPSGFRIIAARYKRCEEQYLYAALHGYQIGTSRIDYNQCGYRLYILPMEEYPFQPDHPRTDHELYDPYMNDYDAPGEDD